MMPGSPSARAAQVNPSAEAGSDRVLDQLTRGGGKMAERMKAVDWSAHPLGLPETWPQSLRTTIRVMLKSRFQMWLGWGPELFFFYNDAYMPTLGLKEPQALGKPFWELWREVAEDLRPRIEGVTLREEATWDEGLLLFLERSGFPEETYHTFSYSPIPDDHGGTGGLLSVVAEETDRIIGERRMIILRELATELSAAQTEAQIMGRFSAVAQQRSQDYPFALIYLFGAEGKDARLASAQGIVWGDPAAPLQLTLGGADNVWPFDQLVARPALLTVPDLSARFPNLPTGPWDRPPREAALVPLAHPAQAGLAGFLVVGLNPHRPFDAAYRGFLELVGGQLAGALSSARAYEAERRRAEALAELDRAKTTFFSNVSHELRTPLTLMLGPLEDTINGGPDQPPDEVRQNAMVAHRNGLRLLKLVNTLLDFARIESGRMKASFVPVDLARATADLASAFSSAMDRAGLNFVVECPPLSAPVYVDPDQWEKIVLNLISNAFKYTLQGEVRVTVGETDTEVVVAVADTGSGIPPAALPHLFERFYRVEGSRGRSQEGTGIGLALVADLVKLHGGRLTVQSELGRGSTFTVQLPRGARPVALLAAPQPSPHSDGSSAGAFREEAARWLPDGISVDDDSDEPATALETAAARATILLADDNSDMRHYVARLLSRRFNVVAVSDGREALDTIRRQTPDLVLSDVMMPQLDGFELLKAIRDDSRLREVPIILLSARAGEEARIEGVARGADDYLVKPFSARELVARVTAHIELSRLRTAANQTIRENEERLRTHAEVLERQVAERTAKLRDMIGELEAFSYSVSHDLRAPLRSMQGYAKALMAEFGEVLDKTGVHYLNRISSNAERMDLLVRDVLAYSKVAKAEIDLSPVDLDVFLPSLAVTLTESAPNALTLDLQHPLPTVLGHAAYLSQIFTNLIGNAVKFSRSGFPPEVTVAATDRGEKWEISVKDNGIGIDAAHFARIFEMFGRVHSDQAYEGTGIGLAIVKKAVLRMGGEIGVESERGQGTRFWFTLRKIS